MGVRLRRYFFALAIAILLCGCSTSRNTRGSRWWHAFTTQYNVYYNGAQAYVAGSLAKEQGVRDDYTTLLSLYTVGNPANRTLGAADYDLAIEKAQKALKLHSIKRRPQWHSNRRKTAKDREWLNRKEYNPALWKAWLLLGRAQFMKGAFDDAAATFNHTAKLYATHPAVRCKAQAWLTRCYIYTNQRYEAEDIITKVRREPLHWAAIREWDYTYADYYLLTQQYDSATVYLRKAVSHQKRLKQRARIWYLIGQVEHLRGQQDVACKAFKHVLRLHPPYELALHARISMAELMAQKGDSSMIAKLRRMARKETSSERADFILAAIDSIKLHRQDTAQALALNKKYAKVPSDTVSRSSLIDETHAEDSLYAATYNAFKAGRYAEVLANDSLSAARFPNGDNRDKFLFVSGISSLDTGDINACLTKMQTLVSGYPKSELREMAKALVNGINAGRRVYGSGGSVSDAWERNTPTTNSQDSTTVKPFSAERNTDFSVVLVYNPDSVDTNKLLFELARYNFTNFLVRSFDIQTDNLNGVSRMRVDGFRNYDEALQYAQLLNSNAAVQSFIKSCRTIIISHDNLSLLSTRYSYRDYEVFFNQQLGNKPATTTPLLNKPTEIEYLPQDKKPASEPQTDNEDDTTIITSDDDMGTDDEYYDIEGF